jgi:hypothetical protein
MMATKDTASQRPGNGALPLGGRMPSAEDEAYDIRIAADGTWYYQGTPINRMGLVKLFAGVLRRDEAGDYWLVTPAERGRITVEDAPFLAVELDSVEEGEDQVLTFRTNLDHRFEAGPDHPIRVSVNPGSGEPRPYILVANGLEALIVRSVFYDLVDRAEERNGRIGVWSKGVFFALDGDD